MKQLPALIAVALIAMPAALAQEAAEPARHLPGLLGIDGAEWQALSKDERRQHLRSLTPDQRRAIREALGFPARPEGARTEAERERSREARRADLEALPATKRQALRDRLWGGKRMTEEQREARWQRFESARRVRGPVDPETRAERQQARRQVLERRQAGLPVRLASPKPVRAPQALGTIQYDNNIAMGRFGTGARKGNRFNTALTAMGGGPSPVIASGSVTQVSAVLTQDAPPGTTGFILDPVATVAVLGAGTTTGMAVPITTATVSTAAGTVVVTFATPVNYLGPSFHVAFRDLPGTSVTTTYFTLVFFTTMYTTTTPSGMTYMHTYTFATGFTYTNVVSATSRLVPATSTGTVGGQGHHGIATAAGTAVANVPGVNFLVRARGNVVVPVELMNFTLE